jgi:hypothetical protein
MTLWRMNIMLTEYPATLQIMHLSMFLSISIHPSIYQSVYSCYSSLEHRASVKRFVSLQFLNLRQSVGLLGQGTSPSQGRYLYTGQHKRRINEHIDMHALSRIRTHDPSVWAGEDGSCLRPQGHCDQLPEQCQQQNLNDYCCWCLHWIVRRGCTWLEIWLLWKISMCLSLKPASPVKNTRLLKNGFSPQCRRNHWWAKTKWTYSLWPLQVVVVK